MNFGDLIVRIHPFRLRFWWVIKKHLNVFWNQTWVRLLIWPVLFKIFTIIELEREVIWCPMLIVVKSKEIWLMDLTLGLLKCPEEIDKEIMHFYNKNNINMILWIFLCLITKKTIYLLLENYHPIYWLLFKNWLQIDITIFNNNYQVKLTLLF